MPIRKRGESWQIDVRTAEGTRIRRTYPTQEAAQEAEAAMMPNPQQRTAMRKLRRAQSVRSNSTPASVKVSRLGPGMSRRLQSQRPKSPVSVMPGGIARPVTGGPAKAI